MASLIPDSVKDTLGDILGTYADIQTIKMRQQLAQAQASLANIGAANILPEVAAQNAQYARQVQQSSFNAVAIVAGVVGIGALLFLAVK